MLICNLTIIGLNSISHINSIVCKFANKAIMVNIKTILALSDQFCAIHAATLFRSLKAKSVSLITHWTFVLDMTVQWSFVISSVLNWSPRSLSGSIFIELKLWQSQLPNILSLVIWNLNTLDVIYWNLYACILSIITSISQLTHSWKSVFILSVRVNTSCVKSISSNQLCLVCLVYYNGELVVTYAGG